jgi:hypothetical protein
MPLRPLERRVFGRELTPSERDVFNRAAKLTAAFVLPLIVLGLLIPIAAALYVVDRESEARTRDINRSRAEATYTACLESNQRNEDTVAVIDGLIADAEENGDLERAERLRASKPFTVLILNAAVPVQNCDQRVRDRYGFVPEVPVPTESRG